MNLSSSGFNDSKPHPYSAKFERLSPQHVSINLGISSWQDLGWVRAGGKRGLWVMLGLRDTRAIESYDNHITPKGWASRFKHEASSARMSMATILLLRFYTYTIPISSQ